MNENNIENHDLPIHDTEDEDVRLNDEEQIDNEMLFDVSSIIRMATDILQMDSFGNSMRDINEFFKNSLHTPPEYPEEYLDNELIVLTKEDMEKVVNELAVMQKELSDVKEENKSLYELFVNLERRFNEHWDASRAES